MISQNLDYFADGKGRTGYLAYDEAHPGRRPGVLVLHEGAGLGEHVRERARRLAGLGYVAFALDLFGGPFESREQGIAAITGMTADPSGLRRHADEALTLLKARAEVDPARTAVIGFCFGGWAALEIARGGVELGCVVSFHGGLRAAKPAGPGEIKCPVLVCTGADDPHVPADQRAAFEAEMTAAGADWRINLYGGAQHGFTDASADPAKWPGSAYHAAPMRDRGGLCWTYSARCLGRSKEARFHHKEHEGHEGWLLLRDHASARAPSFPSSCALCSSWFDRRCAPRRRPRQSPLADSADPR